MVGELRTKLLNIIHRGNRPVLITKEGGLNLIPTSIYRYPNTIDSYQFVFEYNNGNSTVKTKYVLIIDTKI